MHAGEERGAAAAALQADPFGYTFREAKEAGYAYFERKSTGSNRRGEETADRRDEWVRE